MVPSQTPRPLTRVRKGVGYLLWVALVGGVVATTPGIGRAGGFCQCTRRRCAADDPCVPCKPKRLLVGGNATSKDGQPTVYWHVDAEGSAFRFAGVLIASADKSLPMPRWPGFPGTCDDTFCTAAAVPLEGGFLVGRRFAGTARYPDGSTCDVLGTLEWTSVTGIRGTFTCRDAAGTLLSEGDLDVQLIRAVGRRGQRRAHCK